MDSHFTRVVLAALLVAGCAGDGGNVTAFVGARIIDGTGADPIERGVILVRDGRIQAIGPVDAVTIPSGAARVDVSGRTIIPGLINAHGHVGDTRGLETGQYSAENVERQLELYARYGVTTVNSLGGDQEAAIGLRQAQDTARLDRARLYLAGTVVTGDTPAEALEVVDRNAAMGVDFLKFRVDDNLGTVPKMSPDVYRAVITRAREHGIPTAAHVYYLADAKDLLRSGVGFLAHSVRDRPVDEELIRLLNENNVCLCPTLTREVSTFVYEDVPDFFEDPFFLEEADSSVIEQLKDPRRQRQIRTSRSAQAYKQALQVASRNLERLADGGVTIAFGTDTGPPARFQGYFEHMELELMAEAGLSPMQVLVAATGDAARCLGLDDLGTLEPGKWADLVVLRENPLENITNSKTIESVWIGGNQAVEWTS